MDDARYRRARANRHLEAEKFGERIAAERLRPQAEALDRVASPTARATKS
jgi:hypothetical protein